MLSPGEGDAGMDERKKKHQANIDVALYLFVSGSM
jgi:hypothetical protein